MQFLSEKVQENGSFYKEKNLSINCKLANSFSSFTLKLRENEHTRCLMESHLNSIFYRKFDEQADILSNNNQPMGLYETILEIRKQKGIEEGIEKGLERGLEEGLEEGLEKGIILERQLSSLEKIIELADKGSKGGIPNAQISTIFNIPTSFVNEFVKNRVDVPLLNKQLKKIRTTFKPAYQLSDLQKDLVKILLAHQFSVNSTSKVLRLPLAQVKKIQQSVTTK